MKKSTLLLLVLIVIACSPKVITSGEKPLYEVLTRQNNGGASIRFYEILTEPKEIKMLLNDDNLEKKINAEDINTANFVILNMGEKNSGGYSINVKSVIEAADKIIITVEESAPKRNEMATSVMSYPYTIVKVNSKKPIVIQ